MKKILFTVVVVALISLTQNAFAAINNERVLAGTIKNAYVEWVSTSSINITSGYGDCNGHYFEVPSDVTLSMSSVDGGADGDFYYIYIDDSAASYPTLDSSSDFRYDTEEPAWSDSKQGWYGTTNTDDRCIGVVWVNDSDDIEQFKTNAEGICYDVLVKEVLTNGNPSSSWQTVEASAYFPVNATQIMLYAANTDWDSRVIIEVATSDISGNYNHSNLNSSYAGPAYSKGWHYVPRGFNGDIKWYGEDDDDNGFLIRVYGWKIER